MLPASRRKIESDARAQADDGVAAARRPRARSRSDVLQTPGARYADATGTGGRRPQRPRHLIQALENVRPRSGVGRGRVASIQLGRYRVHARQPRQPFPTRGSPRRSSTRSGGWKNPRVNPAVPQAVRPGVGATLLGVQHVAPKSISPAATPACPSAAITCLPRRSSISVPVAPPSGKRPARGAARDS